MAVMNGMTVARILKTKKTMENTRATIMTNESIMEKSAKKIDAPKEVDDDPLGNKIPATAEEDTLAVQSQKMNIIASMITPK
jgi:hypothetical protein